MLAQQSDLIEGCEAQEWGVVRSACRKQGAWTRAGCVQRQMGRGLWRFLWEVLLWLSCLSERQAGSLVTLWGDGEEGQQTELGGSWCSGSKAQVAAI